MPSARTWRTSWSSSRAERLEELARGAHQAGAGEAKSDVAAGEAALQLVRGAFGDEPALLSTAIRSASWSASSRYWVVSRMVTPEAAS